MSKPATTHTDKDPKIQLISAIRGWVHMDNLAETFNKQATNARQLRSKHETTAIQLMKDLHMESSSIQITGGATLQIAHRKERSGLTWGYLEREVVAWATHARLSPAQAQSLLSWLQTHRETHDTEYLKKGFTHPGATTADPRRIEDT